MISDCHQPHPGEIRDRAFTLAHTSTNTRHFEDGNWFCNEIRTDQDILSEHTKFDNRNDRQSHLHFDCKLFPRTYSFRSIHFTVERRKHLTVTTFYFGVSKYRSNNKHNAHGSAMIDLNSVFFFFIKLFWFYLKIRTESKSRAPWSRWNVKLTMVPSSDRH